MITFQNVLTKNIFVLPKDKALSIIKQEPNLYNIISGIEKDLIVNPASQILPVDLSKDIYNLVVVSDIEQKNTKISTKTKTKKRKTTKKKSNNVKKKEI